MNPLTVLLHHLLELLPLHLSSDVTDLPDGSPGAHVLRPLGEGVGVPGVQHHLGGQLVLSVLDQIVILQVSKWSVDLTPAAA